MTSDLPIRPDDPVVLLFTGPPGTGKSTLADLAATTLGAPVFGWDWAMASLTDFELVVAALRGMSHLEYRRLGWSILWNMTTAQLRRGRPVVLDGVARAVEIEGCRQLADREDARLQVVVTSCSDEAVHRRRVEGRVRGIPGWHELHWDHVEAFLVDWTPPGGADLYLDAMDPLESNAAEVESLIHTAR